MAHESSIGSHEMAHELPENSPAFREIYYKFDEVLLRKIERE
jgi:hypothetical protein